MCIVLRPIALIVIALIVAIPAAVPAKDPGPAEPQPTKPAALCELSPSRHWDACVERRVQVRGRIPSTLQQHPLLTSPAPNGAPSEIQSYLDTADGTQLIVLSHQPPPECPGAILATGTLQAIHLDGPDGSKNSYQGWALREAELRCAESAEAAEAP
ncbi:MAG: hypothetical protein U1F26_01300 [Lysobacterales bacterium]